MQESAKPKVTVNEEYIDLRQLDEHSNAKSKKNIRKSPRKRSKSPVRYWCAQNEDQRYEKKLINCGLRNLATSYVTANSFQNYNNKPPRRRSCLSENSQSDSKHRRYPVHSADENQSVRSISDASLANRNVSIHHISSSTPVFTNKKTTDLSSEKIEPLKNKGTMTREGDNVGKRKSHVRSKSKDYQIKELNSCVVNTPYQNGRRSNDRIHGTVDPRLTEKYSILKVPCWKRSWTIPVFSRKRALRQPTYADNFDRQTYLYDEGSEIDSMYIEKTFIGKVFPKECLVVFFLIGAACGILLASLLIYIMFGNNVLQFFLKPRELPESTFKSYVKYLGGGIIYMLTKFFSSVGEILSIPVQPMYEPRDPFKWRTNTG